jgi:CheY-like chemotaxis protein
MKTDALGLITPSILVVDDEKQILSSLRLRLGDHYQLACFSNPQEALTVIPSRQFDLCIVDVHMPDMDGLEFVEAAQKIDPGLGYLILSGFDSHENLRRAIPLQVLDFIAKPFPDRSGFEKRLPDWIERTRTRRRELAFARDSENIVQDLELARIERDVESTASESAREALLQTANLLTTVQALLLSASYGLESLYRTDPKLAAIFRSLQEARRNAEVAGAVAEGYFGSAYADRESSPAVVDTCLRHAVGIALRLAKAEERRKTIDLGPLGRDLAIRGLTGIDFLLMLVPTLVQTLVLAPDATTTQIRFSHLSRLDEAVRDSRLRSFTWVNRRNATISEPGILLSIRSSALALEEADAGAWLRGNTTPTLSIPSRGLLHGIQKAKGLLGIAVRPMTMRFELVLALPI